MNPDSPARQRTYAGWQQEKVAALYGLSAPRAAMLSAAALSVIAPLGILGLRSGLVLWPAAVVLAVSALVRVNGRTGDEWLAGLLSYLLIRAQNQHKFAGGPFRAHGQPATVSGEVIRDEETPADEADELELPGILAPLRLLSVPAAGRDLAVVEHRYDRTYTAVARVRVPGIGLSDSARRDQRVAGWGSLLAGLCTEGGPVTRVQVVQRLVPESGAALRSWHDSHLVPDAPALAAMVAADLLATSTLTTSRREAYLAVTMDARRAATQVRAAGGGDLGAAAVLVRLLRGLQQALSSADLEVEDWLGTRDLAEVIRTAYDPDSVRHLSERRAAADSSNATGRHVDGLASGVDPGLAGPAAAQANVGNYAHDGATSVTYWVYNWPKHQVPATCLAPLLGEGAHRRSFSMHIEPLSPRIAERDVMRERTARSVAVRMRERTGQIVPEHEKDALIRANVQDAERAAGHGLARFTGYVTVTVTDPEQLPDACAALEADAAAARIELRRMWFAQDIGFALSCLPLGFGLPRKRW